LAIQGDRLDRLSVPDPLSSDRPLSSAQRVPSSSTERSYGKLENQEGNQRRVGGCRSTRTSIPCDLSDGPIDPMSLINLSVKHGRSLDEARSRLETAVHEIRGLFGAMVQRAEWSADRNHVRIDGAGFWVEMTVDEQHVHASGDILFLGNLLGG